jgi:uncharacterized protein
MDLLAELEAVYADADRAFSGWSCPASTECCRFGITGREPYVTSIELEAIRRRVAALGGPRAIEGASRPGPARPSLALAGTDRERRCPMLTAAGRCAVYTARPLGCRTFYCDRAAPGAKVRHREVNALVRRIQDLAARHAPEGDRGRPLTRALDEAWTPSRAARR